MYYYCRYGGIQYGLGYDLLEARREFARIVGGVEVASDSPTYGELVSLFAEWSESFSSPRTREDYLYWLKRLGPSIGIHTPIDAVTIEHVDRFVSKEGLVGTWAEIKVRRCLRRLVRWSRQRRHIGPTPIPLDEIRLPSSPESPDATFSEAQYVWMMRRSNPQLRAIIRFLWHTGCRPEEASKIKRGWVDVESRAIRFPISDSKRRRQRTIVYPVSLDRMIRRRLRGNSSLELFLNTKGSRWTPYAIDSAFDRFPRWAPDLFPQGCYARIFRYSFATRMIKRGVDLITLSHLMGHADLSMLRRHYAKLGNDLTHLRQAVDQRTRGPSQQTPAGDDADAGAGSSSRKRKLPSPPRKSSTTDQHGTRGDRPKQ